MHGCIIDNFLIYQDNSIVFQVDKPVMMRYNIITGFLLWSNTMVVNVTHFGVLMRYASELGKAKRSGDTERIKLAQQKHDEYYDICVNNTGIMSLGLPNHRFKPEKYENCKSTN